MHGNPPSSGAILLQQSVLHRKNTTTTGKSINFEQKILPKPKFIADPSFALWPVGIPTTQDKGSAIPAQQNRLVYSGSCYTFHYPCSEMCTMFRLLLLKRRVSNKLGKTIIEGPIVTTIRAKYRVLVLLLVVPAVLHEDPHSRELATSQPLPLEAVPGYSGPRGGVYPRVPGHSRNSSGN
eukprot:2743015-Rhodomonas_salina.1